MATPMRRQPLASRPASSLTEAEELGDAVRGFLVQPRAQSRKRARPQSAEDEESERRRRAEEAAARLKRVKRLLRAAEGDGQRRLAQIVLDEVASRLGGRKVAPEVLERVRSL